MLSTEFLIAAMIVVLIPGTGVFCTIATGIVRGRPASVAAAFGCTFGILPAIAAAFIGLLAILHASAIAYTVLKYAGAAFLIYLAWQTWNGRGPISLRKDVPVSFSKLATTGFLVNVLNPKLSIFFLTFLPQFIDPGVAINPQLSVMSLVFMGMTFAIFVVYGAIASAIGPTLRRTGVAGWIRRSTALTFAGLGARLALTES